MKINDIVYMVGDRDITKTRIVGVKDLFEREYDQKPKIVRYYFVQLNVSNSYRSGDGDNEWVSEIDKETKKRNIYTTLEEAQEYIKTKITNEVLEQINKITLIDVSGGEEKKDEGQD